jgi:hypothetical protein
MSRYQFSQDCTEHCPWRGRCRLLAVISAAQRKHIGRPKGVDAEDLTRGKGAVDGRGRGADRYQPFQRQAPGQLLTAAVAAWLANGHS